MRVKEIQQLLSLPRNTSSASYRIRRGMRMEIEQLQLLLTNETGLLDQNESLIDIKREIAELQEQISVMSAHILNKRKENEELMQEIKDTLKLIQILDKKTQKVLATSADKLQITDLVEVLQLLKRHGYSGDSYYDLGLYLSLSFTTLDAIRENERYVESCLRECLKRWLQKADDVQKKGGPTIYLLVSALRKIEQKAVADGIDMEMHPACNILAHCSAQLSLVSALPQLVLVLHTTKLIKEITLPTNVQGEALLGEIKEAVCKDYLKLIAFSEILCKVRTTAEIGNTIMKKYREVYHSNDFIQANDANGLKIYLPMNVTTQFKMMRLKMGQTFFRVGSIMMNNPQSPSLDNIKYILGAYNKALRPQLAQCEDIYSILQLVCDNSSLNDISVLEFFVDEFNIEEAKPVIEEYKKVVEELKEMKLSQCLNKEVSFASPLECERIIIIVHKDTYETTLNDIKELSSDLFKNSSLQVKLTVIRDGN